MGDFCRFFHIRTIPRKALPHSPYKRSVCLASALSLALHQHPCLACPSRCTEYCHPHNHCKRTIIPCPAPPLPPLSKVRCCRPKKFGRLPEGLPHRHPLPCTNPSKTALSLAPHHHTCLPCQRELD